MISRIVFCFVVSCGAVAASTASSTCILYRVDTSSLPISKEPGGDIYIDLLEDGKIACVTRQQKSDGRDWGFISHKLQKSDRQAVNGWALLRDMKKLSAAEAKAASGKTAQSAAAPLKVVEPTKVAAPSKVIEPAEAAAPLKVGAPSKVAEPAKATAPSKTYEPAETAEPSKATEPAKAATLTAATAPPSTVRPEDTLSFSQPVPFGPYPVNGRSLKELAESTPLFPPIEGIEKSLWKKKCTTCHKWNQQRLCEQGGTYAKTARYALRHQHPFGGSYKTALMRWSKSGCK